MGSQPGRFGRERGGRWGSSEKKESTVPTYPGLGTHLGLWVSGQLSAGVAATGGRVTAGWFCADEPRFGARVTASPQAALLSRGPVICRLW